MYWLGSVAATGSREESQLPDSTGKRHSHQDLHLKLSYLADLPRPEQVTVHWYDVHFLTGSKSRCVKLCL